VYIGGKCGKKKSANGRQKLIKWEREKRLLITKGEREKRKAFGGNMGAGVTGFEAGEKKTGGGRKKTRGKAVGGNRGRGKEGSPFQKEKRERAQTLRWPRKSSI